MKRKIKNSLSLQQQKKLFRFVVILLILAFFWLLFAPGMGLISLYRENKRLADLRQQKIELEAENAALRVEIDKIQTDIDYFERIARDKHKLLKKNEVLFDFSKEKEKKE